MQEVLTQSQLSKINAGSPYNGVVLIKKYGISFTKNGKEYIQGEITSGITVTFKAWNNSKAFLELKTHDYIGVPVYIVSSGDNFGGQESLILDTVVAMEGYTLDMFLPSRYNIEGYLESFRNTVNALNISQGCKNLINEVLFDNKDIIDRFKMEFAASSHHDNCKGGLLAHTYKVVAIMKHILNFYPMLTKKKNENGDWVVDQNRIDLLYFSTIMHDVGKIWEMNYGVYQPDTSVVTHRYMGVEYMLEHFKGKIVQLYGEHGWYEFVSVMLQHHGEFADPARSLIALVVHKADNFESDFTLLTQCMDSMYSDSTGEKIKYDGNYYSV